LEPWIRTAPNSNPFSVCGLPAPYSSSSRFALETFACVRAGSHIGSWRLKHPRGAGFPVQSSRKKSGGFGGAIGPPVAAGCDRVAVHCAKGVEAVTQSTASTTVIELRNINPPYPTRPIVTFQNGQHTTVVKRS